MNETQTIFKLFTIYIIHRYIEVDDILENIEFEKRIERTCAINLKNDIIYFTFYACESGMPQYSKLLSWLKHIRFKLNIEKKFKG